MVIDTSPTNPMDFRFGKEKQKSAMQCLINNCKVKVFNLFYHILKYQHVSLSLEVIVILFRLFQGLHFVFDESLSDVQQPYIAFNALHSFLSFFHVVPFLKHNSNLYLLAFYGSILVGVVIILLLVYIVFLGDSDTNVLHTTTTVDVSNSSKTVELFLQILSTLMDYTTRMFVIPFLSLFLSIYSCDDDNKHSYINDVQCWSSQHVIHVIIGSVFVVLFVLFAFVYNALYFETSCAASGATAQCNPIAASTAKTNVSLLIEQALLRVYFQFKPSNTNNWITVVLLLVTSIYSLSLYMNELPHYNRTIRLFQLSLRIIMFYSSLCLFISKVMQALITFNSGVYLFLFSLPLILVALCIYPIERSALTFRNISTLNTPRDYLDKINALFFQIDNFSSREAQLALRGYAVHAERTCTMKNCALSKYIKAMNTPNEAIMHIYSHIELIYQAGISRNPFSVKLRISYLLFLIQRVSKHYLALHQIAICISIERSSLEEQFILFRYQKLYDEYGDFRVGISSIAKTGAHTDMEDAMLYKKYSTLFKSMVTKTLCSYINFWNLLYEENTEHSHDLSALHRLGTKINHEVNLVHKLYTTITEMNQRDDIEIMKLYYEFVNEILLDTDKANAIKHKIHEKEKMNASCNKKDIEIFDSFNIYQLNKSDHYHYIVLDTKEASFSNIINLSIGLCPIFGFTKNELLGKTLDMLLPGFLRNGHRNVLKGRLEQYLKDETNEPTSTAAASAAAKKLQFNERTVFAVNKAKYIVPLYASICFYRNDKGELFWLVKVAREDNVKEIDYSYNICGNKDKQYCSSMQSLSFGSSKNNPCYVMTNNKFIIQHFSANCVKYLGFNSDVINNTTDISVFIKEFSEEFLKCAIEKENSNNKEERACLKKKIICSRFNVPTVITWKYMDDLKEMITSAQHNDNNNNSINIVDSMMYNNGMMKHNSGKIIVNKHKRATFMMSVVELAFTAQYIEGYIFKFVPITTINKSVNCNGSVVKTNLSSSELCSKNNNNKVQHVQTLRKQSRNSMGNNQCNEQGLIMSTHSIIQVNNCVGGNNNEESSFTFIPQNQVNNNNMKAFDIDKTYMPSIDNGKVFCFEPETLVFKMSNTKHDTDVITTHNNNNTNEYLRTQALKKIHLASHFNTHSNTNDSDVHSHSHSNNDSSNSYSSCSYDDVSNNDDDVQSGDSNVNKRHYNNNHNKHSKNTHKRGGSLSSTTSDINDSNDDNNDDSHHHHHHSNSKHTFMLYGGVTAFNQGKHSISSPTQSDTYYQVNFSKIKFSIYNFAKGHFEDVEYEKKSAVEKVKDASNANKPDHSSSSSLTMNNKSHSSLTSSQHGAYCASSSMHSELPQTQKLKLKSIIHQIKTSLKKEDTQPTIIRIAIISIIIFILMVGGALLNLLMARASITSVRRRFYHMKSALYLQRNSIVAINNIRELALLNFPEYNFDDFQLSKTSLTSAIIDKLRDVHVSLCENVEDILHNIDDVHDESSRHFIMNTKINVYVLEEDFNVYEYNFTLINAVYKTIGAIFQIIETNGTAFYPLNLDGYYAFHNILNGLLNVSNTLIDIYNKEISNEIAQQNKVISILFAVNAVVTMCSYWFIKNAYADVIKVKESYLKVFFEIGSNVIMFSLCRCESLVKTIQNEENEQSEFFDDNSGQDSAFSALHGELLLTHANVETKVNKVQTAMNNSKSEQTGSSHVYRKVSKEEKAVQSVILLFLFSAVVVAAIVYVLFYVLCDMIKGYYLIYNYENELQVHILVFHIITKEYIFERNSLIYNTEMTTYTETLIKEFHMDYKRKSDQLLKYHKHFPAKFKQRKVTLDEEDLCVHLEDFFAERKDTSQHFITKCDEVLYGTPQYGLSVVISAIANSLREVIREVQHGDVVRDELNLKYNLSLYGTEDYYTNTEDYAQRKELYDKHSLMNYLTGKQMKHIQFVSKHLMFLLFEETLLILQNSITEELNEQEQSIVIGYSVYIVIIVFVFLCVWRKYVSALSKVIYKTKNMLSIIPKEVLSTLSSIHRLLNINTNITIDDTTTVITSSTTFEEDSSMLEDNSNN